MATIKIPYGDAGLPAFETGDTYINVELLSGDTPLLVTENFPVAAGVALAAFSVVGLLAGNLALADDDQVPATRATGTVTFSGQPANADTVTIAGQVYTFKTVLTATAGDVLIGASQAASVANLLAAINTDAGGGVTYAAATPENPSVVADADTAAIIGINARDPGTAGNAITLAKSGANIAVSAATLAGGSDQVGVVPIGITNAPVLNTGNAQSVDIFRAGCFNPEALTWGASYDTDAKKAAAFRGAPAPTNILIRKFRG